MTTRPSRTVLVFLAALYFAAARLGLTLALTAEQVTLVWPPTGLALAALLVLGSEAWPSLFVGAFLANATVHEPLLVAASIAAGNTLEAIVAAALLRRFFGFGIAIERLKHALGLVLLAAVASTTLSATVGVTSLCVGGVQPWHSYGELWGTWWLGDAAGDLLVAPTLLTLAAWRGPWRAGRTAEAVALATALIVTSAVVFGRQFGPAAAHYPFEYAVFPLLIWAALRFGIAGVSLANILTAAVALLGTVHGFGPYGQGQSFERLLSLQVFMAVAAATALLLGAVISEREASARRRHAEHLVTQALADVADINDATRQILQIVCERLDWDVGLVWRVNRGADRLECLDVWSRPPARRPGFETISRGRTFAPGVGLPGRVWADNAPFWIVDVRDDPTVPHAPSVPGASAGASDGLLSALAFPIAVGADVLGVFEFLASAARQPDADVLQTMKAVGAEVGQFLARKHIEQRIHESEARKAAMLAAALDCIITIDRDGRIVEFNPAAERTFGYQRGEVLGREMAPALIPAPLRAVYRQGFPRHTVTGEAVVLGRRVETTAIRKDGTEFPVELSIARIASAEPLFTAYLRDITDQRQLVNQLAFQATHDGLTGVLNHASFMQRLRQATAGPDRAEGGLMAVLFVDVDRFKAINDTLGHLVGDHLLVALARRLQSCVRPHDAVARIGGDEFAILLEGIADSRDATAAADRILETLARPFTLDGHRVIATASIGVTLGRSGVDRPEDLLRAADTAMYGSKASGPAQYRVGDRRHA
jgi:diguanylate cyclase (GGDEF)-like protein/PAS domain S-box-containing protein